MYADDLLLISSTCSDLRRMLWTVFNKHAVYNTVTLNTAVFFWYRYTAHPCCERCAGVAGANEYVLTHVWRTLAKWITGTCRCCCAISADVKTRVHKVLTRRSPPPALPCKWVQIGAFLVYTDGRATERFVAARAQRQIPFDVCTAGTYGAYMVACSETTWHTQVVVYK